MYLLVYSIRVNDFNLGAIIMKIIKYGLIGAVSLMLAACGNGGEEGGENGESNSGEGSGETVTLQLGHALSPGTPASDQIDQVAENVSEKTEGRVEFDVYPDSQLGSETEMLRSEERR